MDDVLAVMAGVIQLVTKAIIGSLILAFWHRILIVYRIISVVNSLLIQVFQTLSFYMLLSEFLWLV
ncbi:hypothetical protein TDB9533_04335 [Thalassocella blandensis]|nr:hypothetical protein TDB9533_04335 [Thalassocella blandensis]